MKKLPSYLEKIIDCMATAEARSGGMSKEKARDLFKSELINESLTAKANPSPRKARRYSSSSSSSP
jgi:hypothetical protein